MNNDVSYDTMYEPPTFDEVGTFRDATGLLGNKGCDPITSCGGILPGC